MFYVYHVTCKSSLGIIKGRIPLINDTERSPAVTSKIDLIPKKLKTLQDQHQALESRLSTQLYREIQNVLGESFSPSLALTLIQKSWSNSSKSKETWLKQAGSFPT